MKFWTKGRVIILACAIGCMALAVSLFTSSTREVCLKEVSGFDNRECVEQYTSYSPGTLRQRIGDAAAPALLGMMLVGIAVWSWREAIKERRSHDRDWADIYRRMKVNDRSAWDRDVEQYQRDMAARNDEGAV